MAIWDTKIANAESYKRTPEKAVLQDVLVTDFTLAPGVICDGKNNIPINSKPGKPEEWGKAKGETEKFRAFEFSAEIAPGQDTDPQLPQTLKNAALTYFLYQPSGTDIKNDVMDEAQALCSQCGEGCSDPQRCKVFGPPSLEMEGNNPPKPDFNNKKTVATISFRMQMSYDCQCA
jgi:hypothetical protein